MNNNNNNNQKLVPIIAIIAAILCVVILVMTLSPKVTELKEKNMVIQNSQEEKSELEQQYNTLEAQKALSIQKMNNLKTIYETDFDSDTANTGKFGNLFNTIIVKAQSLGLLIYEIAYDLNPKDDPIATEQAGYNVCELQLTLVGSYNQLKAFITDLNDMSNLIYLSRMNVTAFPSNTDYLFIRMSVNLYSKKAGSSANSSSSSDTQPFKQK